jgi:hypothetical protein
VSKKGKEEEDRGAGSRREGGDKAAAPSLTIDKRSSMRNRGGSRGGSRRGSRGNKARKQEKELLVPTEVAIL